MNGIMLDYTQHYRAHPKSDIGLEKMINEVFDGTPVGTSALDIMNGVASGLKDIIKTSEGEINKMSFD